MTPELALQHWLDRRLAAAPALWLRDSVASLAGGGTDRDLFRSVSLVSRQLGKAPLALDAAELAMAEAARPGWDPSLLTVDEAGRIRLLLAATTDTDSATDSDTFVRRLDQLCATADVDELVAFYRGLPVYPDAPRHRLRAAEGLRTNMRVVFEAVAHHNPYPTEQLPEEAWNQMVLKALFVGSRLAPIVGLDRRANATLARMLGDYAHERWSAGRPVSPELWRCVGPFAAGPLLADLARVLEAGTPPERAAAVLALRGATGSEAHRLLDHHAALRDAVAAHHVDWQSVLEYN
ncbi:MAG: EboA domain-containing protein [Rubrivivax sp.]|nr:EboA domain-containing protein [Rubrivivax sp.]